MAATSSRPSDSFKLNEVNERSVIKFINHELRLLDARRFEDWADLFTEDGYYWAPVNPDQADPQEHVSLFFDDKNTMQTRIARLRHPRIHVQTPPSRTVHLVSNFQVAQPARDLVDVRCNFILFEYRSTKSQNIYGGVYEYNLIPDAGGFPFRIRKKKATLINSEDSFSSLAIWF